MDDRSYDVRALVQTYIETRRDTGPALKAYYLKLLSLLQRQFGVDFAAPPASRVALSILFRATVDSYLSQRTPWSHFLEEGLIVRQVEDLGDPGETILRLTNQIAQFTIASRETHLQMLYVLFENIYGRRETVVTSADLRAQGFDDANKPDVLD